MENFSTFQQFVMWLGPYKWPMFLIAFIILVLIIWKIIDLFFSNIRPANTYRGLNSILFWGSFGLAFGMFVQIAGIWEALKEIMVATDLSPSIVLIGFYGSFVPTLFGISMLLVAALAWWLLRMRAKRLDSTTGA
jgi:hypothetical protein